MKNNYEKWFFRIVPVAGVLLMVACTQGKKSVETAIDGNVAEVVVVEENTDTVAPDEGSACEKWIVDAYRKWMTRDYRDTILPKQLFTPELRAKLGRLNSVIDADALLRAQDYSDYGVTSVKCRPLGGDWYEVSYAWSEGSEPVTIPVKVVADGDSYRLAYVTPEWGDYSKVDELLGRKGCDEVNQESADEFVRTFYCNYTYLYAMMVPDLEQKLQAMCGKYCSGRLNSKIAEIKEELKNDMGGDGYDPLVQSCDFDIFWLDSLDVTNVAPGEYHISFKYSGDYTREWTVRVAEEDGKWVMDDIVEKS